MRKTLDGNRRLWLALAAVATIAIGSYALAPAIGGGLFTKKKAKRLFYTKPVADQRFAPAGSSYSKSEADSRFYSRTESDSRFLSSSGDIRVAVHGAGWEVFSSTGPGHEVFFNPTGATFVQTGGPVTRHAGLPLTAPVQQFGRTMKLVGLEYCYDTTVDSTLSLIAISSVTPTATTPNPMAVTDLAADSTARTDASCRTLVPPTPVPLGADDELVLRAVIDYTAATGQMVFSRTSLILRP